MPTADDVLPRPASFPPGLIGDVAYFIMRAAPHPNPQIALAAAIALLAGITGKAFNTYTFAGLNQYILILASTGMGKEAANSGISKLLAPISAKIPGAATFKGPVLVSSAGLIKWLAVNPSFVSVIGEFGYKLKALSSSKASPNDELLKAVMLDLYGKSGMNNSLDPMAYSDRDKTTPPINSPAFTLLCESVPSVVNETLNEHSITSGFLPRFMIVRVEGPRSKFQENPVEGPDAVLVDLLAALASKCLALNSFNNVHVVAIAEDAKALFLEFNDWITDQINASASEIYRELWNRVYLKALKLATLCAVSIDFESPIVTMAEANWATGLIVEQTRSILAQFENGEVGVVAGNEARQQNEILRCIYEYIMQPFDRFEKYGVTRDMHSSFVFTQTYLSRRVGKLPAFAEDRAGATNALKRAIQFLLDADEIQEVARPQMISMFGGKKPRAFVVPHPTEFIAMCRMKFGGGV
jgi:hypothetical protein